MNEPLSIERFRELAAAYGGEITRWPPADRRMAARWIDQPEAATILIEAAELDRALDTWTVPPPSRELAQRIAAAAPVVALRPARRVRLWLSGIGIAAALAGTAAGTATVLMVATPDNTPTGISTSFGYISTSES